MRNKVLTVLELPEIVVVIVSHNMGGYIQGTQAFCNLAS